MDKITKFLKKLDPKTRRLLLKILVDIKNTKLSGYDVKPLKGHPGIFRIRKGSIRIVFRQTKSKNLIVNVAFHKDAYK